MKTEFEEIEGMLEVKSQEEWAEYAVESLKPTRIWKRFAGMSKRFYWSPDPTSGLIPDKIDLGIGITTAISNAFAEPIALKIWKENNSNWKQLLKDASEYGTLMHTCISEHCTKGKIDESRFEYAEFRWSKGNQLRKDILAFLKLKEDLQLVPLMLEGILAAEPFVVSGTNTKLFVLSAIDSYWNAKLPIKRKRIVNTEEVYKVGEKKGQFKQKEETYYDYEDFQVIIDFKSNFFDKEKKDFFEQHRQQLLFGKHVLCREFGFDPDKVLIYNWSPNGWRIEPSYTLTEHTEKTNKYGFTDSQIMYHKLTAAFVNGDLDVNGTIFVSMSGFNELTTSGDYLIMDFEEFILHTYYGVDIRARRLRQAEEMRATMVSIEDNTENED
jgi:hypothetical protein